MSIAGPLVAYPQPGKAKSRHILEAFARGAGGSVVDTCALEAGPAAFYGVVGIERLWRAVRDRGDWMYLDNAYFDATRGKHFRVGVNALQASGTETPDWIRFGRLALGIQPWRKGGRHVLVIEQSEHFMREVADWPLAEWRLSVRRALGENTDRPIVVRHWSRDKLERARTLHDDLRNAWALVTHASAAANEALVAGVPVFITGACAAAAMGLADLSEIERPRRPDNRMDWAAALAGQQWSVDEFRDGTAWRSLNG